MKKANAATLTKDKNDPDALAQSNVGFRGKTYMNLTRRKLDIENIPNAAKERGEDEVDNRRTRSIEPRFQLWDRFR